MSNPLVSVRVVTYNHEKYIAQCLEGILMQRTNFPFEVIVGEDCSTDNTRKIVFDYQAKFPEKIRVITSEKNVGGMENAIRFQQACNGKYHALCEGDDYWIDPLKLQKQADFMEAHPEYSMCCHDALVVRDDKNATPRYYFDASIPDVIEIKDLLRLNLAIPTASMFARADAFASIPEWRKRILYGDLLLRLWCAHHGKIKKLTDTMSVYRVHPSSLMAHSLVNTSAHYELILEIYQKFDAETDYQYATMIKNATEAIEEEKNFKKIRQTLGKFYIFVKPNKAIERLRLMVAIIGLYDNMYAHIRQKEQK